MKIIKLKIYSVRHYNRRGYVKTQEYDFTDYESGNYTQYKFIRGSRYHRYMIAEWRQFTSSKGEQMPFIRKHKRNINMSTNNGIL